jgi:hypothetical protein
MYRKIQLHKVAISILSDNTGLQENVLLFLALQSLVDRTPLPQLPPAVLGPASYVSNSLYLQITLHAGLSLSFPSGFHLQKVLKINHFYGMGLSASRLTPNLEDKGIPFSLGHHLDLSGMGGPTSSYATTSTALRII